MHVLADGVSSIHKEEVSIALDRMRQAGVYTTTSESFLFSYIGMSGFLRPFPSHLGCLRLSLGFCNVFLRGEVRQFGCLTVCGSRFSGTLPLALSVTGVQEPATFQTPVLSCIIGISIIPSLPSERYCHSDHHYCLVFSVPSSS